MTAIINSTLSDHDRWIVSFYRNSEISGAQFFSRLAVDPITNILLGALFLGEMLTAGQFAGFAFTALGLAVIDGRLIAAIRRRAFA